MPTGSNLAQQFPYQYDHYTVQTDTWNTWVQFDQTMQSATDAINTLTTTWYGWIGTVTAYDTTGDVWHIWNSTATTGTSRQLTPGERAGGDTLSFKDWIEEQRKAKEKREAAAAKARLLLEEHLSADQRKQLAEKSEFEVEAESGKRYVITRGRAGNVVSLDEARKRHTRYCIHPTDHEIPDEDVMLSQMLWLKWNEREFLKVANATRIAA